MLVFILSTSYRLSIQAKYYYIIDDYKQAYSLASQAYKQSTYNMMAFTIRQQSLVILELKDVISQAKEYYKKIQSLVSKNILSNSDRIRIKFLCQIIIDKFDSLNFPLLDKSFLYDEAKQYRDEFVKILESIEVKVK
jgi:hypothetical protein